MSKGWEESNFAVFLIVWVPGFKSLGDTVCVPLLHIMYRFNLSYTWSFVPLAIFLTGKKVVGDWVIIVLSYWTPLAEPEL